MRSPIAVLIAVLGAACSRFDSTEAAQELLQCDTGWSERMPGVSVWRHESHAAWLCVVDIANESPPAESTAISQSGEHRRPERRS